MYTWVIETWPGSGDTIVLQFSLFLPMSSYVSARGWRRLFVT